jgi:hypothetical protein
MLKYNWISKTDFQMWQGYYTCQAVSLWFKKHFPDIKSPPSIQTTIGNEVGAKAREFAIKEFKAQNPHLIETLDIDAALAETRDALKKNDLLFEPAFEAWIRGQRCICRLDILHVPSLEHREVKAFLDPADPKLKAKTVLYDMAFTSLILAHNGIKCVPRLMHVNKTGVPLFKTVDQIIKPRKNKPDFVLPISDMITILMNGIPDDARTGCASSGLVAKNDTSRCEIQQMVQIVSLHLFL